LVSFYKHHIPDWRGGMATLTQAEFRVLQDADKGASRTHGSATRTPDDWKPADQAIEFARRAGLSDSELRRDCEKFRTLHPGVGSSFALRHDWASVFRMDSEDWGQEAR
jgi:hypothetical protein